MMYSITSIDLKTLRNAEIIQFGTDSLKLLADNDKKVLKVADEYDALNLIVQEIIALYKIDQGSNTTPKIEAADLRRDNAVIGIFKNADSHLTHFEEKKRNAAILILSEFALFGTVTDIARMALPAETATIKSIVSKFTTDANFKAAITELGLDAWVAELNAANLDLEKLYLDRTKELAGANPNTIKDKRLEFNQAYYNLRDMLQSQATVAKGAAPFAATINQWNALIDQYNTILNNRAATPATKTEGDGTPK